MIVALLDYREVKVNVLVNAVVVGLVTADATCTSKATALRAVPNKIVITLPLAEQLVIVIEEG
jgi:hypothetical protein